MKLGGTIPKNPNDDLIPVVLSEGSYEVNVNPKITKDTLDKLNLSDAIRKSGVPIGCFLKPHRWFSVGVEAEFDRTSKERDEIFNRVALIDQWVCILTKKYALDHNELRSIALSYSDWNTVDPSVLMVRIEERILRSQRLGIEI